MKLASPLCIATVMTTAIAFPDFAAAAGNPKYRMKQIEQACGGEVLNARGQVTGATCNEADPAAHAYLWSSDGTFKDIDKTFTSTHSGSAGNAVNFSGQVTGGVWINNVTPHVFLWRNNGTPMVDLGTLGGNSGQGIDINDAGQIAGNSDLHAFFWQDDGHGLRDLGTFGGATSTANAINSSGQVTGSAGTSGSQEHAFLWKNDGTPIADLGTLSGSFSQGLAINDAGQVTGEAQVIVKGNFLQTHAFFWRNNGSPMKDLGTLGGGRSQPTGINRSGQVTGNSRTGAGEFHAFIWKNDGSRILDLGTLGGTYSFGQGINALGWVVGRTLTGSGVEHAFLWINDGLPMRDLNDLIDPADPLKPYIVLGSAVAINDAGDIVAEGRDSRNNGFAVFLLRTSALAISPQSLSFGQQAVGTASGPRPITVRNNSSSAVAITGIKIAGSNAGQFSYSGNCGASLAGNGSCTIQVTFKPTSTGNKSAALNVNGGGNGLRTVSLAGRGA